MTKQRPGLAAVMALVALMILYRTYIRPWMYRWGATAEEIVAKLPGDDLVQSGPPRTTRAISIDAPVDLVWPWLARRGGERGCQMVAAVEPKSHLVLVSKSDFERVSRGELATGSWAFHLRPANEGTRLLIRGSGGAVGHATFDVPHFIMERKMMLGIRRRAERLFQNDGRTPTPWRTP
jgi:hypothetical protein